MKIPISERKHMMDDETTTPNKVSKENKQHHARFKKGERKSTANVSDNKPNIRRATIRYAGSLAVGIELQSTIDRVADGC
jgi:hypothetical protein